MIVSFNLCLECPWVRSRIPVIQLRRRTVNDGFREADQDRLLGREDRTPELFDDRLFVHRSLKIGQQDANGGRENQETGRRHHLSPGMTTGLPLGIYG